MKTRITGLVAALALSAPIAVIASSAPADAATTFRNCTALHHVWHHGVAKSAAAAAKQVRAGYGRPAFGPQARAVYAANYRSLDRDRDGTACEA